MKLLFVIFVSALALSAADPQAPKKPSPAPPRATAKPAPKAADAPKPMTIPPDAVLFSGGDYRYTDPQGKKWIYRKTPFGVVRLEENPERDAAKEAARSAGITATEDGDNVRFERAGPFGLWKWEKKKSELDDAEKAALQHSQANNNTVSKQD